MNLTRKQEQQLIDLGLRVLLDRQLGKLDNIEKAQKVRWKRKKKSKPNGTVEDKAHRHPWSAAQHRKFKKTMSKIWAEKKAARKAAEQKEK